MDKKYVFIKGFEGLYLINRQGYVVSLFSNKGDCVSYVKVSDRGNIKIIKEKKEYHLSLKKLLQETFDDLSLNDFVFIKKYPNYMINRKGNILSLRNHIFLKPQKDPKGYLRVRLSTEFNKIYTGKVHRLVAEQYIRNPLNKPQINHINGNKEDNTPENLEWVTLAENMKHAWKHGYFDCHKGKSG